MDSTNSPLVKWGWLRAIIFVPVYIISTIAFLAPLGFILEKTGIKITNELDQNIITLFLQTTATFLAIYLCRKLIDRKDMPSLGFRFKTKDFLKGCLLGIILISIGSVGMAMAGWADFEYQNFNPIGLFKYLIMFILVAIYEETMVRTYFLHSLMQSMDKYLALIITAAIFSILHFRNPSADVFSAIEIFLAGILLGIWYIHYGNIWFPIGLHLTWNYFQGPIWGHEVSGTLVKESLLKQTDMAETLLSGGKFGVEGSLIGLVLTILGGVWIEWHIRRNKAQSL